MSDSAGLKNSQRLSQFVQDYHVNKWKQIGRTMPEAKPTPVPVNFQPAEFVDTSVLDFQKLAQLLRSVGIQPLIGEPLGSPMQRLHISSSIGQLNARQVPGIPNVSSLEDIALLTTPQRAKLFRAVTGQLPPRRTLNPGSQTIEEEKEGAARDSAVREGAGALLKEVQRRAAADRIMGVTGARGGESADLLNPGRPGSSNSSSSSSSSSSGAPAAPVQDRTPVQERTRQKRSEKASKSSKDK
jgi:hypothetical protein